MRFSEQFGIKIPSEGLPFVDISLDSDTLLFIDPAKIRLSDDEWCRDVTGVVQDYFGALLTAVKNGDQSLGMKLLSGLHEPTETRLGYSAAGTHGHGVGPSLASDIWIALTQSAAAKSGLLEDLEEAALLIEDVNQDRISDIVTNVVRLQLAQYTQRICDRYDIPTAPVKFRIWDPSSGSWRHELTALPQFEGKSLLLVPKRIASIRPYYAVDDYMVQAVIPYLQDLELNSPNQDLVKLLKNKSRRVFKKDVREKYGDGKDAAIRITRQYPEILREYRQKKSIAFKK